jgi:hypothetical protein
LFAEENTVKYIQTNEKVHCGGLESQFAPTYPQVPGSLYIDSSKDTEKLESIISFLGQFITINNYSQPLLPYSHLTRIDTEDGQISTANLQGIIHYIAEISDQELTTPVPLFASASTDDEQITFTTSTNASNFNDPLEDKQSYLDTIQFARAEELCPSNNNKKKIRIAIIDSAFETNHEDLGENVAYTKDVAHGDTNIRPPTDNEEWHHGTFSAGIIGATTNNER